MKCILFILLPGNGGFRVKISICVPSVVQIRNAKKEQKAAHDTQWQRSTSVMSLIRNQLKAEKLNRNFSKYNKAWSETEI